MQQGFAVAANTAPEVIRASAREAEALGYSSFWVNYPGSVDGLTALALAARETRRIKIGVGVIPLNTRGPDSIAAGVRANALPLDRLLLGVGSADPGALKRVRDGVAKLRSRLAASLFVAALGPRMCYVAGEVADGVLFNWLTPEHARRSAEWVNAGASAAGRQPPVLFAYVRIALGPAGERLLVEGARYAAIPAYGDHFARMKAEPLETAIAAKNSDAIRPALLRWQGALDEIILRAVTAGDTVEEYMTLLQAAKP
jgi:alkanesulfonate monooxygenase SsuD/methylene tetrahydromethanopterin reductase-like flavin-dependent oxidoreductase (luciferase family)